MYAPNSHLGKGKERDILEQLSGNEGVYMQARRQPAGPYVIRAATSTYAIGIARGNCGRAYMELRRALVISGLPLV